MKNPQESSEGKPMYQTRKLFIKNLPCNKDPSSWEKSLLSYFNHFGPLIDIKILQKRILKSKFKSVWFRNFQRRRDGA